VVFGAACWYYALRHWRARERPVYLALMALALGFAAGAKTSGLPICLLCGIWTLWSLRANKPAFLRFAAFAAGSFLLMGSVETYANNLLTLRHLFGDPSFIATISNREGVRGAAANCIRYLFGFVNIGFDSSYSRYRYAAWTASRCRYILRLAGLGNAGYCALWNDRSMLFLKDNMEESTDFGPVGAIAAACALGCCLAALGSASIRRSVFSRLALAGFASLGITCLTVGWMPWNNRFLMLPMILFSVALTLPVVRAGESRPALSLKIAFLALLLFSAIFIPSRSFNKTPRDLWLSMKRRDYVATKRLPTMLDVVTDVKAIPATFGPSLLLLNAGEGTWVLPVLQAPLGRKDLEVLAAPSLTRETLFAAAKTANGRQLLILTLKKQVLPAVMENIATVRQYAGEDTVLFKFQPR